ncbi:hypothetical protein GGS20DRAFT_587450 [Poronia punctata]|nr:hypothetical protein GGS20DRAFT_587450 [Poronia punctata]
MPDAAESHSQSPPRRPRACMPCTKAKTRCHYDMNEVDEGCSRCRRLIIFCAPQTTKIVRRPRILEKISQVDADGVRHAADRSISCEDTTRGLVTPADTASPQSSLGGVHPNNANANADNRQQLHRRSGTWYDPKSLPSSSTASGPGFGISWLEADRAVEEFTTIFTAHFPFIIPEHDVTARRLFVDKPLLFRTILMTSIHFTLAKKRGIRRSVDAWIGQHLLVMDEKSLGVLQGLIVYVAWENPHFYSDGRATQLIYLALDLAHSLGITNYAEYCLDSLKLSSEFPTDFLLFKIVKFRLYMEQSSSLYRGDMKLPTNDQLEKIREEVDSFMDDVTHHNPKFFLLWTLSRNAPIQIHLPTTYLLPETDTQAQFQLDSLEYCLDAAKPFTAMIRHVSPDGLIYAPYTTMTDFLTILISIISRLPPTCRDTRLGCPTS